MRSRSEFWERSTVNVLKKWAHWRGQRIWFLSYSKIILRVDETDCPTLWRRMRNPIKASSWTKTSEQCSASQARARTKTSNFRVYDWAAASKSRQGHLLEEPMASMSAQLWTNWLIKQSVHWFANTTVSMLCHSWVSKRRLLSTLTRIAWSSRAVLSTTLPISASKTWCSVAELVLWLAQTKIRVIDRLCPRWRNQRWSKGS